ncbi:hypothetical protein ACIN5110_1560 [Acinetobacter baumannii OIFC110]|nr:hypothetical protein ACIN5110_1560 [Acinetobacter baumannii OIFC110]
MSYQKLSRDQIANVWHKIFPMVPMSTWVLVYHQDCQLLTC